MTALTRARTSWIAVAASVAMFASLAAEQQQQPTRDPAGSPASRAASIVGVVVQDDESGRPVRRAAVHLSSPSVRTPRMTMTDDSGRFVFEDLAPGSYAVTVTKPAHVNASFRLPGARGTGPSMIALAAGARETVTIRMKRGAVIAGVVRDAQGQPLAGQRVQVWPLQQQGGRRMAPSSRSAPLPTDEHGRYRVFGLAPGDYLVSVTPTQSTAAPVVTDENVRWARQQATLGVGAAATPPPDPGPVMGLAPVYFPGTNNQGHATVITLQAGEERTDIDLALTPVVLARVSGILTLPDGRPPPGSSITLARPPEMTGEPSLRVSFSARSDPQGRVTFTNVPPGIYVATARVLIRGGGTGTPALMPLVVNGQFMANPESSPGSAIFWLMASVHVNGADVTDLPFVLQPALDISGRVVFEGAPPPDVTRVRVSASQMAPTLISGSVPASNVAPDGTFTLRGSMPGRYRLTASVMSAPRGDVNTAEGAPQPAQPAPPPPVNWTLKSIVAYGRDILDVPLDLAREDVRDVIITFSALRADLEGSLVDTSGRPAPDYNVVVFSVDRSYWTQPTRRVRNARTGTDGRYRLANLPAGEYYLVAVADLTQFDWTDPAILEQLAAASFKFTIAEGEKKVQDLKIAR